MEDKEKKILEKKLLWCSSLKDGLRIAESSERLAQSYLAEAKGSLVRAEKNFQDGDLLWTTVVIYYAEYYALYAFLRQLGIKCENHACSIMAVSYLLGEEKTKTINDHKQKRIDAQYYMKVGKEEEVKEMLNKAKLFVAAYDEEVTNVNNEAIKDYREKMKKAVSPAPGNQQKKENFLK